MSENISAEMADEIFEVTPERDPVEAAAARVARLMAQPGLAQAQGFEVVQAAPGEVTLAVSARPTLMASRVQFHGGALSALAEQAAAMAAATVLPEDKGAATVSVIVNHHRAAVGQRIYALARVVSAAPVMTVVEVRLEAESFGGRGPCGSAQVKLRTVPAGHA